MSRYKWTTKDTIKLYLPETQTTVAKRTLSFKFADITLDSKDKLHSILIRPGYSWNGCGPGKSMLFRRSSLFWNGRRINYCKLAMRHTGIHINSLRHLKGDVQELYFASLAHDVLCQYSKEIRGTSKIRQKDIDKVFLRLAKQSGFLFPKAYYKAIRLFQSSKG